MVGLAAVAAVWFGMLPYDDLIPRDAHAYWAVDATDLYAGAELGATDAYLYSPAFAQATAPLRLLPFDAFRALWALLAIASLAAIGGLSLLAAPPVIEDLVRGNIHLFMSAAIVAGFRWPSAWAFVLLTKVSAGIGLLWFAARGEWVRLELAIGGSVVIVLLSVALGGIDPWREWVSVLVAGAASDRTFDYLGVAPPPLVVRLPVAALLVAWGARTDRRWTVPVSAMLALPVLWPSAFAMLAAAAILARPFARSSAPNEGLHDDDDPGNDDQDRPHLAPLERRKLDAHVAEQEVGTDNEDDQAK